MRAIVVEQFGPPESLTVQERPEPEPLAQRIGIVEADFGVDGHARAVTS